MKRITLLILFFLSIYIAKGQVPVGKNDSMLQVFNKVRQQTLRFKDLWGLDIYNNILFVERNTREIYANAADSAGILKPAGEIFRGQLPAKINMANTSLHWGGKHWAMVMLPLPTAEAEMLNLVTHELFHRAQPELGFQISNPSNNHLDQKDGRIYLRLELQALQQALKTKGKVQRQHLQHALHFRTKRYNLYPQAKQEENALELLEGLPEYTGMIMSGRNRQATINALLEKMNRFLGGATYVRSFAYHTVPAYGLLFNQHKWLKQMNNNSSFYELLFSKHHPDTSKSIDAFLPDYNGQIIISEETAREEKRIQTQALYRKKFVEDPHVVLGFEKMNISFDPGNIVPLENEGTVYPSIRVTDNWGILTVRSAGGLINNNWQKITVTAPFQQSGNTITGDGWTLEINPAYQLIADGKHFKVAKR